MPGTPYAMGLQKKKKERKKGRKTASICLIPSDGYFCIDTCLSSSLQNCDLSFSILEVRGHDRPQVLPGVTTGILQAEIQIPEKTS